MSDGLVTVEVPDIGDFEDVPIIEILVSAGDTVAAEDPLVTLESDKATMDVPAPASGVVKEISVKLGDRGVTGVGVDDARRGQRRCAGRRCAGCGCAGRAMHRPSPSPLRQPLASPSPRRPPLASLPSPTRAPRRRAPLTLATAVGLSMPAPPPVAWRASSASSWAESAAAAARDGSPATTSGRRPTAASPP